MKIQPVQSVQREKVQPQRPRVTVATNLVREREFFDRNGNVVDMRTKRVIKQAEN